ncbi:MAG TPA: ArsR family transcriptional regulator, partial [Archaeoglobaceae archaeon]|nr:ArsR family transcriptional regulator [Archaeoglobaceae archaeon]
KLTLDLKERVSELVEKKREELKRTEQDLVELEEFAGISG